MGCAAPLFRADEIAGEIVCVRRKTFRESPGSRRVDQTAYARRKATLLHRNPVRTSRSRGEGGVEIHVKTLIQFQVVFVDSYHVNVVIAFEVNLPKSSSLRK